MARTTEEMLGTAPIGRVIWSLALPTLAANLINCLYNIVDRMYIGRIPEVGTTALTGVGVTFPIIMLCTAFANFAGMGGAPLAGIQLGAGNREKAEDILSGSLFLLLCSGIGLTVLVQWFKEPLLYAFGASDALIGYGLDYLSIYVWGSLFVQLAMGLNPFISAQGRSGVAMVSVLVGAVLNILLDPLFIFTLGMGVKGAALASVISQAVSAIWVVSFLRGHTTVLRLFVQKPQKEVLKKTASLGLAPFIMASTESLVTIALNSSMQKYGGDLYVGSITILQSLMMVISLPAQSVSYGTQPLISYNYGAKNFDRVRAVFRRVFAISLGLTVTLGLCGVLFSGPLSQIFTTDKALMELCGRAGRIFFFGFTLHGAQIACQASFVGLGQAKASLFAALLRKVILMIPLVLVLPLVLGGSPLSIYFAEPVSDVIASVTTLCLYLHLRKRLLPVAAAQKE